MRVLGGAATRAGVHVFRLRDRRRASGLDRPSGAVRERHKDEEAGLVSRRWRRRRNPRWSREHGPGDLFSCMCGRRAGAGHRWGVVTGSSGAMAVSGGAEATSRAAYSGMVALSSATASESAATAPAYSIMATGCETATAAVLTDEAEEERDESRHLTVGEAFLCSRQSVRDNVFE